MLSFISSISLKKQCTVVSVMIKAARWSKKLELDLLDCIVHMNHNLNVVDDLIINTRAVEVDVMDDHLIMFVSVELNGIRNPDIGPRAIRHNVSNEWISPPFEDLFDIKVINAVFKSRTSNNW